MRTSTKTLVSGILAALALAGAFALGAARADGPDPYPPVDGASLGAALRDGDLVFHESRSAQSEAVRLATGSRYTHVGIVFLRRGRPFVLEAAARVRSIPFDRFRARGAGGEVLAMRLRDADVRLDRAKVARMRRVADGFMGRPYDARFEWSDARLYCSELVYKIYERGAGVRIGALRPAGSFELGSPEVKRLVAARFGGRIRFDPDEPVLSPAAMVEDAGLVVVTEGRSHDR